MQSQRHIPNNSLSITSKRKGLDECSDIIESRPTSPERESPKRQKIKLSCENGIEIKALNDEFIRWKIPERFTSKYSKTEKAANRLDNNLERKLGKVVEIPQWPVSNLELKKQFLTDYELVACEHIPKDTVRKRKTKRETNLHATDVYEVKSVSWFSSSFVLLLYIC